MSSNSRQEYLSQQYSPPPLQPSAGGGRYAQSANWEFRFRRVWLKQTLKSKGWEFSCPLKFIGSLPEGSTRGLLVGKLLVGGPAGRCQPERRERSISEISSCLFWPRPWHIEIRYRVKKRKHNELVRIWDSHIENSKIEFMETDCKWEASSSWNKLTNRYLNW